MPLSSSPATFGALTGSPSDNAALTNLLNTLMPAAGGAFTGLTGAGFRDGATYDVTMGFASSTALTEARSITWDVKNASHSLKFTAASIVTFPSGTNTLLGSAVANTITANGAASTPALSLTGTILTGQTSTTNKPHLLIEPTGTTSNNWSTAGTLFGGNAPSGFTGNMLDLQINGTSEFSVTGASGGYTRVRSSIQFGTGGVNSCGIAVHTGDNLLFNSDDNYVMKLYGTGLVMQSTAQYGISDGTSYAGTPDVAFARTSPGVGRISDGSTGRGTLDAAGYQVGGVAGTSGTITAASTVTVVNGIVTVIA